MSKALVFVRGDGKMDKILNLVSVEVGRKRWSIKDLEREADIAYGTAWALYHGKAKGIQFDTLAKLCRALGRDVGELFQYEPDGQKSGDA